MQGHQCLDESQLTLREDTDTATPRTPIPIYFIHTLHAPFCQNPRCACHGNILAVTRLLGEVVEGIFVLDNAEAFLEPPQPVRIADIEALGGIPEDCRFYGHSWERGGCPGEKICALCGLHGYCPLCVCLPPPNAQPFTCTRHAQRRQVQ
jgi:hypothetical protein